MKSPHAVAALLHRVTLAVAMALAAGVPVAGAAPHGILRADIDTAADPCTDFFQYANGSWRKAHPIPSYMDRWSRRWESGETNKAHVRDILTQVSARSDWPRGSAEQPSGDFYAACMDEKKVEALGAKPVEPWLAEIRAIEDKAGIERMIVRLHEVGIAVPFGIFANEDLHDPSRTIAHVFANGLGMPDRDYFHKPEARFVEAREKYAGHVARMFGLAGTESDAAKQHAATVFAFEKRRAQASLDNVALRDPKQQDHMTYTADDDPRRPASDREIPRQRAAVEPFAIRRGIRMQGRRADGPAGRGALRSLVIRKSGWARPSTTAC